MKKIQRLLAASAVLGVVSLVAFIFERLAMTDIFHGESDLTLEWQIIHVSFLPILIFHILAVAVSLFAIRAIKGEQKK